MKTYEITYQIGEEVCSVNVEGTGPVDAEMRFRQQRTEPGIIVLCVVLQ